jgi:hypothetical protein
LIFKPVFLLSPLIWDRDIAYWHDLNDVGKHSSEFEIE